MGTRADFYVGRGPDAEWIGSLALPIGSLRSGLIVFQGPQEGGGT